MSAQNLLIANWKMWGSTQEWCALADEVAGETYGAQVVLAPPMCALPFLDGILAESDVALASQNVSKFEDKGHTGEVSAAMLSELKCEYVLLGHSERRIFEGETNQDIAQKLPLVQGQGMVPVLCIGETLDEKQAGETAKVLDDQLLRGLEHAKLDSSNNLVIAYEPVWAISNLADGAPEVQKEDIVSACKTIRERLVSLFGEQGGSVKMLYGGSVSNTNASQLIEIEGLNGFLVGSASLKANIFVDIAHILG